MKTIYQPVIKFRNKNASHRSQRLRKENSTELRIR